jgi:hypothetical protein
MRSDVLPPARCANPSTSRRSRSSPGRALTTFGSNIWITGASAAVERPHAPRVIAVFRVAGNQAGHIRLREVRGGFKRGVVIIAVAGLDDVPAAFESDFPMSGWRLVGHGKERGRHGQQGDEGKSYGVVHNRDAGQLFETGTKAGILRGRGVSLGVQ